MRSLTAYGESRLLFWQRVREFAVPPSMIESATARRIAGDWAGACAAARVDVDLDLRAAARVHGRELAAWGRADLRWLARWTLRGWCRRGSAAPWIGGRARRRDCCARRDATAALSPCGSAPGVG